MARQVFGKQQDWVSIKKGMDKPIITIVTATFNVEGSLHWTYNSIKNQTYPYIQWIVIDGNSKDNTVELLRQYGDVVDVWFSEPDTGIYNAWNKALPYIQGDWVQFLGAGDELYQCDVLEKVVNHLKNCDTKAKLAYGKILHISEKKRIELFQTGMNWNNYTNLWDIYRPELPVYSGIYQHRSLFELVGGYDEQYKVVADNVFVLQCLRYSSFEFLPFLVAKMPLGGLTGRIDSHQKIIPETKVAMKNLGIKIPLRKYVYFEFKYFFKDLMFAILGRKNLEFLMDSIKQLRGKNKVWNADD